MSHPKPEPEVCHDLILQIISYQIKDYMRDHVSVGLFMGMVLFAGILALNFFGLFLFCFCLARGEQVTDAQDFGWQSKGEDHFRSWFPFFSCLPGDKFVLFRCRPVQRPFCMFLPIFDQGFSFLFCFLPFFDWGFSFFFVFSFEGKD